MITHIVLFKLTDPTNTANAKELLLSMNGKVPMLRHLEVGADIVRSERSYDLALYSKFDTMADLQAYQIDPYHAGTILPFMRANCSSIVAVDYDSDCSS
jgi:hypothetical protein